MHRLVASFLATLLLCLLAHVNLSSAQSSVPVMVGRTKSLVGSLAGVSRLTDAGYAMWIQTMADRGGLTVGGVTYSFEMKEYNDASDPELMPILYDRLITVDKVNFLFLPPFIIAGLSTLAAMAENASVVTINMNALGPAFLGLAQPRWIFSTYPPINQSPASCAKPLREAGASTYVVAVVEGDIQQLQAFVETTLDGLGFTKIRADVITQDMLQNPTKLDPLIEEWKKGGADLWTGGGVLADNVPLVNRMRERRYEPKAMYFWAAAGGSLYPADKKWQVGGALTSSEFEASLGFPDVLYGNASVYAHTVSEKFNSSAGAVDAVVAVSGEILVDALRRTGSLDATVLRDAILQTNITTMIGPTVFSPTSFALAANYYCFQTNPDGVSGTPVRESLNVSYARNLIYPYIYQYPAKFFNKGGNKRVILIAVLTTVGFLLFVAIVGGVAFLYFRSRFHLVFVRKNTPNEEWS